MNLQNPQSAIRNPQSVSLSVIVCSLNGERVLPACLGSVLASRGVAFEVIVVDNGSTDATAALVRRDFPAVRLVQASRNLGFAGGNNLGIHAARGECLLLLNDDTAVPPDCLARLAGAFARDPAIGAVGTKLLYEDKQTIQHAGAVMHANANTDHLGYREPDRGQWDEPGERTYVTGAALALRRAALAQSGLLDPAFFPIYFEEVDLQTRLRAAGWKIWYEPAAWLVHFESQSQGVASPRFFYRYTKNRLRYLALHGFPQGVLTAAGEEWRFLKKVRRWGRLRPVILAYLYAAIHGLAWRLDRRARKTVPKLAGAAPGRP